MVNTVLSGSHGRIMRDLRGAAEGAGFQTALAYGRGRADTAVALRIGGSLDVYLHVARTRLLDGHARGSKHATKAFVRTLESLSPDILHLHNIHGYYLHAPALFDFIRQSGVKTLWTMHDCWALTGHCSHFLRAACDRWQTGCFACPLKREYPASHGLDRSEANWHWKRKAFAGLSNLKIYTPSKWLSQVLAMSYLKDAPRMVIPNGVDLSLFTPGPGASIRQKYGAKDGQLLLLAVAAPFDARKGFQDALAVAKTLKDKARVILVGLSKTQVKGLPENVTGVLRTDGPEALVTLYSAADCLINPTYEDTYPTVNMEALACGTPVAAYGAGGSAEQMDGHVGLSVPVGEAARLAEAAVLLGEKKQALTGACRAYAEANFDRRLAIEAYLREYRRLGANICHTAP